MWPQTFGIWTWGGVKNIRMLEDLYYGNFIWKYLSQLTNPHIIVLLWALQKNQLKKNKQQNRIHQPCHRCSSSWWCWSQGCRPRRWGRWCPWSSSCSYTSPTPPSPQSCPLSIKIRSKIERRFLKKCSQKTLLAPDTIYVVLKVFTVNKKEKSGKDCQVLGEETFFWRKIINILFIMAW